MFEEVGVLLSRNVLPVGCDWCPAEWPGAVVVGQVDQDSVDHQLLHLRLVEYVVMGVSKAQDEGCGDRLGLLAQAA